MKKKLISLLGLLITAVSGEDIGGRRWLNDASSPAFAYLTGKENNY